LTKQVGKVGKIGIATELMGVHVKDAGANWMVCAVRNRAAASKTVAAWACC